MSDLSKRVATRYLSAASPTKVIYVQWEGRGYDADSWEKDLVNIRSVVGNGPVWGLGYDVGYLFSSVDPTTIEGPVELINTRHGQIDVDNANSLAGALSSGFEDEESRQDYAESLDLSGWEEFGNIYEWIEYAKKMEMLTL